MVGGDGVRREPAAFGPGRWWRVAATLALGAAILAGCGGDDPPVATAIPARGTTATVAAGSSSLVVVDDAPPLAPGGATPGAVAAATGNRTGTEPTADAANTARVTLTDYRVNAARTEFATGQAYTFLVQNNGDTAHQFVIERAGAVNEPLTADGETAQIAQIPSGAEATLVWTFAEAGDYQIACHESDHYDLGMSIAIAVSG